ncbi:Integrase, catalytic core [Cucumis melo var. makuwa]|uniref:Integrase, catalytic core n=1 Tax=Cucumis melo var. makuwa TaxID=1194695 RepID=A0A5A7UF53_CUCMM|nr:Integrase, catalytic core [Cucumis melo var. makuwa]
MLDRFQMANCNPVSTPMEVSLKLVRDHEGRKIDNTLYKQIVGSLMYLAATRPDIMHVEFIAATVCTCQAIWLRKILEELYFKQEGATKVYFDNSFAIKLSENSVLHGRSKYIDGSFTSQGI